MLKFWRLFRIYEVLTRDLQLRLVNYQTRCVIDFDVLACLCELSIGLDICSYYARKTLAFLSSAATQQKPHPAPHLLFWGEEAPFPPPLLSSVAFDLLLQLLELSCSLLWLLAFLLGLYASLLGLYASLLGLYASLLGLLASYLYCSLKSLPIHFAPWYPLVVLQSVPATLCCSR